MTKAELRAEIFRRLEESSTSPVYWTADDVDEAIDDAYAELSDASEWFEQYFEIELLNDRPYYDLRTVIGDSFLAIRPGFNEQTNRWMKPTAPRLMDRRDRRWETVDGEPQAILMRGLWWLGYWPRVQADGGLVKQYYVALPAVLGDDDEPGFPESFHYGIVEFALTDLFVQDAETARALKAWAAYLAIEAGLLAWVAERATAATLSGFGASL
jgi:hypothetical protein